MLFDELKLWFIILSNNISIIFIYDVFSNSESYSDSLNRSIILLLCISIAYSKLVSDSIFSLLIGLIDQIISL